VDIISIIRRHKNEEDEMVPKWAINFDALVEPNGSNREDVIQQLLNSNEIDSFLQGSFYCALRTLPDQYQKKQWVDSYEGRLTQEIEDEKIQNWLSELVQNASDAKASNITIYISHEGLRFVHNGYEFKTHELVALTGMNTSTKRGDISTIGKFGIGFKYWWLHFEEVEVLAYSNGVKHTLSYMHEFNPQRSFYSYENTKEEENKTEFIFKIAKNEEEWLDFFNSTPDEILGGRISESIPMIQKEGQNFSITINIDEREEATYTCDIISNLVEDDEVLIQSISYGKEGYMKKSIRARSSLNQLRKLNPEVGEDLFNSVKSKYSKQSTIKAKIRDELDEKYGGNEEEERNKRKTEILEKFSEDSFSNSYMTIIFTPDEEKGLISNLFIAENVNQCSFKFLADAPWKLTPDRHDLSKLSKDKTWNRNIAELVNELYALTIKNCLEDENNYRFDSLQMYNIINYNIDDFIRRKLDSWPNEYEFDHFEKSFNIDKEKFGIYRERTNLVPRLQWKGCSHAFSTIWENTSGEARKWLENAMHTEMVYVEIKNGEKIPLFKKIDNNDYYEICNSYGDGFPEDISSFITNYEDDGRGLNKKKLLQTIDHVVVDNNGNHFFLTEVNDQESADQNRIIICEELNDDDRLPMLKNLISLLEGGLNETRFYFLDKTYNLEDEKELKLTLADFELIMEKIVTIAFENSKDTTNLERLIQKLIEIKPKDLSWGRTLLTETIDEDYILVILPPKGHTLGITMGQESHEIKGSLVSINWSKLKHKGKIFIHREKSPRILVWGNQRENLEFTRYVRTEEMMPVIIPRKNTADDENLGEWKSSRFLLTNKDKKIVNGNQWPVIDLCGLEPESRKEIIQRITPLFIDGFYTTNNQYNIHKGLRTINKNDEIEVKYEHLKNKSKNANREIILDKKGALDDEILLRAINLDRSLENLDSLKISNFKTNGDSDRAIPNFENVEEQKPYKGGVVRILGTSSIIADCHKLSNLNSKKKLKLIHDISYWDSKILDILPEDRAIEILNKSRINHVFDVFWVTSPEDTKDLMLTSRIIPKGEMGGGIKRYIDDFEKSRVSSPINADYTFKDLQNNGIMGFLETKYHNWTKNISDIFDGQKWLPRKIEDGRFVENFNTLYGNLECVKLHVDLDRPIDGLYSKNWGQSITYNDNVRPGVDRLVEVILSNDSEAEAALIWLEELINCGMPTKSWLRNNKRAIKTKIERNEDWRGLFEKLYEKTIAQTGPSWYEFTTAARAGADKDQILDEFGDVEIPILKLENGIWKRISESDFRIKSLRLENNKKYLIIEDKILQNCSEEEIKFPMTLFGIKEGEMVFSIPDTRIKDSLKQISDDIEDITTQIFKLLETDIDLEKEISQEDISPKLKYIEELLKHICKDENYTTRWYSYEARIVSDDFPVMPKEHCIAVKIEKNGSEKVIHISNLKPSAMPSLLEHEQISIWFTDLLESHNIFNKEEIKQIIFQKDIDSTWWWMLPMDGEGQDIRTKRIKFIRLYCPDLLDFSDLRDKLLDIKYDDGRGVEQLYQQLEDLGNLYENNASELHLSYAFLESLYPNIGSILENFSNNSIPEISASKSVKSTINISKWMLPRLADRVNTRDLDKTTLGSNLIVNKSHAHHFRGHGTLHSIDEDIYIDFSENAYHILWDEIFGKDAEKWFSGRSEYIRFPKLFEMGDTDEHPQDAKLHKLHALHVLAYLGARECA